MKMRKLETRTSNKIDLDRLLRKLNEIPEEEWKFAGRAQSTGVRSYHYKTDFGTIEIWEGFEDSGCNLHVYNSFGEEILRVYNDRCYAIIDKIKAYRHRVMENDVNKLNQWLNE